MYSGSKFSNILSKKVVDAFSINIILNPLQSYNPFYGNIL